MAVAGLLQFTPGLGIRGNQKFSKQHKFSFRRNELHLPATGLPSLASGHDLFTHHVSESIKMPICSILRKKKALTCRSTLSLGSNVSNSCLRTVTTTLARSYNYLQCDPSIIKIVTAVGVVVFAIWGLEPLVRSSRNIFLRKNDNNWRKSTSHYVLTSYLQPALLWTGVMLLCRALDPVHMPTDASHLVKLRVLNFVRSLSTVLSFAYCLLCAIQQAQKLLMKTSDPSEARNMGFQFAGKAVHTAVWVAAVSLFMELLGFSTQKWLTAGGLGTVLLTIAGREIFTNFLSSAMIHATRPFVLNEWIQTKIDGYEVSGTVEHVGWWSPTIIRGEDREAVHIPNHKFTMNVVRNLSQKTHWRIKTHLAINHLDVDKVNNIVADMRKVLAKNPQVEQQKLHRRVFLESVDPENQALLILVSCFVKTSRHEEYFRTKEIILLDLLRVISHHGARLATPIRTIQRMPIPAEMENVSFSESALYRSGAALSRPFLLTEPTRPPRSARPAGDRDSQSKAKLSTPDPKTDAMPKANSASETSNAGVQDDKQAVKSSTSISDGKKKGPKEEQQGSKPDVPASMSESRDEKSNALEENIVLGVALGGSKRTLLIDDDHPNPPPPVEAKEAAANLSSSGKGRATPASEKDED